MVTEDVAYDAFNKILKGWEAQFNDRKHFFLVANRAMVQVVIDHLRQRKRKDVSLLSGTDVCDPFSLTSEAEGLEDQESVDRLFSQIEDFLLLDV